MRPTRAERLSWKVDYDAGATIEEIALDAGVDPKTVRKHLLALGTAMRRVGQQIGKPQLNKSNRVVPHPEYGVVHVAFAGTRLAHRRRGGKRAA